MFLVSLAFAANDALLTPLRDGRTIPCATSYVFQLQQAWPQLTDAERDEVIDRFGDVSPREWPARGHAAKGRGVPDDSCAGQQLDNRLAGSHFVVEWDDGAASQSDMEEFLDALEFSWSVEVDQLGWNEPAGASTYLMPVYIDPGYADGAYTTVYTCGGKSVPKIVAGANSFYDMNWALTMASHEFNHAIQFNTAWSPESFWWEATATYIEESVYPSINYWGYYIGGYSDSPELRMNADSYQDYDEFYHMYGMAIFGFYLDNYQGGSDIVRQTWDAASHHGGYSSTSMAELLADLGIDFETAYLDFIARNVPMEYNDHQAFPSVDEVDDIDALPATGESTNKHEPEGYGQNFIRFQSGALGDTLRVTFDGEDGVPWGVELVEAGNRSVTRTAVARSADGEPVVVEMDAVGEEDVVLVVSPLDDTKNGKSYSWTAERYVPLPPDTGSPAGGDTAGELTEGDKDKAGGCGCATPGATPGAVGLVALAGLLTRRRRAA